jgi:hypothetical protein
VVRSRPDGDFDLVLPAEHRDVMVRLLGELEELFTAAPDDPSTRRLRPPAYLDDPERDQGYQLLAGEELRTSRQAAIDASTDALQRERLTAEELWAWAQSLNALRLVVGTRLGIEDDFSDRHHEPDDPDAPLWDVLDFCSEVQHWIIKALGG